jgi:pyruvate dehydrogenase E2 component (dihydrolipoamide acetyltransferase)
MAEVVIMPKLGFDMAEGTLVRWVVAENEPVEKGQVLAEIETDKATVEVESSYSGYVRRHLVSEGAIVPVNTPIAVIGGEKEAIDFQALLQGTGVAEEAMRIEGAEKAAPAAEPEAPRERGDGKARERGVEEEIGRLPEGVRASPLARRMAEELGIDLAAVAGTGPGGRIIKADIEAFKKTAPAVAEEAVAPPPVVVREVPPDRRVPLSRLRAAVGRRMVVAKQQYPQFYITHEYDVGALMALRAQVNAMLPDEEKTSVNDYVLKGVALALREFPNLNASLDEEKQEVVQFGHINLGVAVAVENGLLTVVCRDADQKSVRQISREVRMMAARAREGKVRPEDIEGSTFSVSNLGMFDVAEFIAILNPPEAAILAVGSAVEVPVVINGEIQPGLRMKATISVDHRVSDGAEAARFLQALEKYLEEPLRLLV